MLDRLGELRGPTVPDVEIGLPVGGDTAFMQSFFDEVQEIKKIMSTIRYNIRQIEQNHGECLTAISAEQSKESSMRLEGLMKETNGAASQVRNKLKTLDLENKDFARRNEGASEARIRSNMHGTLTRKFVDLMAEYQEIQTKYKNKYRERGERQYRVVNPNATREEIDAALAGDQQEIFTQHILQGPGHAQARNALADIQERHRDITRLETSIQELHQLFLDMSVLVESQGELLDQIEYTVSQSVNYTGKAVDELRSANKYQKKSPQKNVLCHLHWPCGHGRPAVHNPPQLKW
uniref:t-SNARE coiled-coil homology domain-containing protein n=1 Tax=Prymnesium polylepis TaxID=72548 RepID=A0A7S4IGT6_9EUKA